MDKKHTTIGILLALAAFLSLYIGNHYAPPRANPVAVRQAVAPPPPPSEPLSQPAFASVTREQAGAVVTTLENDFLQVRFTDYGGAIREVALKKYPATRRGFEPFVFNQLHADPILGLVDFPGLDHKTRYERVSQSASEVVYRAVLDHRLEVTRRYVISPDQVGATDPYEIRTETTFRNLTGQSTQMMRVAMSVGTAAPVSTMDTGLLLVGGFSNGKSQNFFMRSKLEASGGFFGHERRTTPCPIS